MFRLLRHFFLIVIALLPAINPACATSLRDNAAQAIASGQSFDLIVEYDDAAIEKTAKEMRKKTRNHLDDQKTLIYKIKEYSLLRDRIDQPLKGRQDLRDIERYKHMPISHKRINSVAALDALLAQPGIKAIYQNAKIKQALAESLPLINQPGDSIVGENGQNTTVVVIDDGIELTNPAFTLCSATNNPNENCNVAVSLDMVNNPGAYNDHGSNIAAIILGVAPSTKIAALNIFDANGLGYQSDVIASIDWAIENKTQYNIVAINMSLSDNTYHSTPCTTDWSSAAINRAASSGISVVVSSGNSAYTDGLSSPACSPNAISVGAVYDTNVGPRGYLSPRCRDLSTSADQVTCFSNSASFLTLLAPGAIITAADIPLSGTSQSAAHVSGAVAVLRSTYPDESLAQIQARLTTTGVQITDPRNNITTPRLNLLAAATPINDMFANRTTLSGLSGSASGTNLLATKEADEPIIAGNIGGQSLWWKWTAPQSGQLSLNTKGSGFDSLLAIYTGTQLSGLNLIASKDNTGSLISPQTDLVLDVTAGTEYAFSLDVANGAASTFMLNWNLNTTPQASLSATITGATSVSIGTQTTYTLTVTDTGTQSATNVVASLSAPVGATITPTSQNCTVSGNALSCTLNALPNGNSQSFDFQITWNTVPTSSLLTASIASDSTSIITQVSSQAINVTAIADLASSDNADVPLLPEWGFIIFGLTALLINFRSSKIKLLSSAES